MRIEPEHSLRLADRDLGQKLGGARQRRALRQVEMMPQQIADLRPDALDRIERGHRVLRNQRDATAEQAAALGLSHGQEIAALEGDAARGDGRVRRQQSEHGAAEHGLAGAGFTDQSADLTGLHLEADAAQHIGGADRDLQPFHSERRRHERCTGSSARRRPSPNRLRPITLVMMQTIGSAMIHGA